MDWNLTLRKTTYFSDYVLVLNICGKGGWVGRGRRGWGGGGMAAI